MYKAHTLRLAILFFQLTFLFFGECTYSDQNAEIVLQLGHSDGIRSAVFSPDGTIIASASYDTTVKLWNVKIGKVIKTLGKHIRAVYSIAFDPNGKYLVSAGADETINVWDLKNLLHLFSLTGHLGSIYGVAVSPDGSLIASGGVDGTVRLWDIETGKPKGILKGHSQAVYAIKFDRSGQVLASASEDKTIKLWDLKTGIIKASLDGHEAPVLSISFSPISDILASGGDDGMIKLWDTTSSICNATLEEHTAEVLSVCFSPDGKTLVSSSEDKKIMIWNVNERKLVRSITDHHQKGIRSVGISPDNKTLLSAGYERRMNLFEIKSGVRIRSLKGQPYSIKSVVFSPTRNAVAYGIEENSIKIFDLSSEIDDHRLPARANSVFSIDFGPRGNILASSSKDNDENNSIKVWNVKTGKTSFSLCGAHSDKIHAIKVSPSGKFLASGSLDHTVKIWDLESEEEIISLKDHKGGIRSVSFSPKNIFFASAGDDQKIFVWNIENWEKIHSLEGHQDVIHAIDFGGKNETLVSASADHSIRIWPLTPGRDLKELKHHVEQVFGIKISPNGRILASSSADKTVVICDLPEGKILHTLKGHTNWVYSVSFSGDGKILASASRDNTIRLWDVETGILKLVIASLPGHEWIAFNPETLAYTSSPEGAKFAGIRFNKEPSQIYPLDYYSKELETKRASLAIISFQPGKILKPKSVRLWWDSFELKKESAIALVFLAILAVAWVTLRTYRADPLYKLRLFFTEAGYKCQWKLGAISLRLTIQKKEKTNASVALLWDKEISEGSEEPVTNFLLKKYKKFLQSGSQIFLIYKGKAPTHESIRKMRQSLAYPVVPLYYNTIEDAIAKIECVSVLKQVVIPHTIRNDPYASFKPIYDPIWFFGRQSSLADLPIMLQHTQHVGIFGLRKVGKTSFVNQLCQQLTQTPTVFIDCQAFNTANEIFSEILSKIEKRLSHFGVNVISRKQLTFRDNILKFHNQWTKSGRREAFVIIFDEIDKFFPESQSTSNEKIYREYISFYKTLRSLAQVERCLVTLAIAYRPYVNRRNIISKNIGENPMWHSFKEMYLGFLDAKESLKMVQGIGNWKEIQWEEDAAKRIFYYCGGHPLITRYFSSAVSKEGTLKRINLACVEESASWVVENFYKNEIGNYYNQGLWKLVTKEEKEIIKFIFSKKDVGTHRSDLDKKFEDDIYKDALTNLLNFGLVAMDQNQLQISSSLFLSWLKRNT